MPLIPSKMALTMMCVRGFQFIINTVINNYHTYTVLNGTYYDPCSLFAVSSKYDH